MRDRLSHPDREAAAPLEAELRPLRPADLLGEAALHDRECLTLHLVGTVLPVFVARIATARRVDGLEKRAGVDPHRGVVGPDKRDGRGMLVVRRQTNHSPDLLGERGGRVRSKQVDTLLEIHRIRIREMFDERRGDGMQWGEALRVLDDRIRVLRRPVEINPAVPIINNGARIVSKHSCFDMRAGV